MLNKTAMIILFITICLAANAQYKKYSFQQPKMGSPFNVVIYSTDSAKAGKAAFGAFKMIDTLNEIYSDYLPNSELNRLCAQSGTGEWVKVSETLFSILQKSCKASKSCFGSFDITMSPVIRLWRTARREKRLPDKDSLAKAKQLVSYKFIEFNTAQKSIRLKKAGMQLDLGGIAKGETAQRVYSRLCQLGFPFALTDAGGDIVAGDVPSGVSGWRVAINLPESEELMNKQLLLRNKAVTTSGDLYQYLEINDVRYSHIIDPATGWASTNSRNVTVIANNGTNADWLTKACSILPIDKALKMIKKFPSAEVQIAVLKNGKPRFYRSPGFTSYFKQRRKQSRI
jgi:thiamine biosynthesis lipoprotein